MLRLMSLSHGSSLGSTSRPRLLAIAAVSNENFMLLPLGQGLKHLKRRAWFNVDARLSLAKDALEFVLPRPPIVLDKVRLVTSQP